MAGYSSKLLESVRALRHGGAMLNPTASGRSSRDGRAPYTTIHLDVCAGTIRQIQYQTFGCGVSIAACEALAELATGLTLDQSAALTPGQLIEFLDGVPEERQFCVDLALDALRAAVRACATAPFAVAIPRTQPQE